jgi:hypothetical protein
MVPSSFSCVTPASSACDNVEGEARQNRAVHRHRHAHLVERDAVEQDFHVLDAVDRDAGLADIARDARMIAVIAAVGGEIEGDRQALLPRRKVAAIEGIGGFSGGKPGILADCPGAPTYMWRAPRA